MSEHAKAKARYWGGKVPDHLKHGNMSYAARIYGCDCKLCLPSGKRTWRNTEDATGPASGHDRNMKLRANKKGTPVPEGTKHGIYTYNVYACRCPACKLAQAEATKRQQDAWIAKARGRWTSDGTTDMLCWPPKDAGPDWVCSTCNQKEVA